LPTRSFASCLQSQHPFKSSFHLASSQPAPSPSPLPISQNTLTYCHPAPLTHQVEYEYIPDEDEQSQSDLPQDLDLARLLEDAATALYGPSGGSADPETAAGGSSAGGGGATGLYGAAGVNGLGDLREGPAAQLLRYVRALLFRSMTRGRLGRLVAVAEGQRRWGAALRDVAGGFRVGIVGLGVGVGGRVFACYRWVNGCRKLFGCLHPIPLFQPYSLS